MFGRHAPLSPLNEDLRKLGILPEEGPETPGPSGEPTTSAAAPGRNVGALTDKPKEKGADPTDEVPGHEGAKPPEANLPVTPGAQSEAIKGEPDKVRAAQPPASAVDGKVAATKGPNESLPGPLSVREAVQKIRTSTGVVEGSTPLDRIADVLTDVSAIIENVDAKHRTETVKAFANSAIIAEMLGRGYAGYAYKHQDGDLAEAAETLATMAGEARDIALALESGEELDAEGVAAEFRQQMDALVTAMDLYADIVEADDDEEDDEDPEDKKGDKPGGDRDPAEKDEGVRFATPLIKNKGQGATPRPTTGAGAALSRLNMSRTEGTGFFPKRVTR